MDDKEHYERGMAMRRKTMGATHVDRANANKTPFNAEFQDLITRYLWGIWLRPHFDVRTRRVLVIGTLMALGHWRSSARTCAPRWWKAGSPSTTSRKSSSSRRSTAARRPETARQGSGRSGGGGADKITQPPRLARKPCGVMPVFLRKNRAKWDGSEKPSS
jgi:hypothetical protein